MAGAIHRNLRRNPLNKARTAGLTASEKTMDGRTLRGSGRLRDSPLCRLIKLKVNLIRESRDFQPSYVDIRHNSMLHVLIKTSTISSNVVALPGSTSNFAARFSPEMSSYGCYSTDSTSSPWAEAHATNQLEFTLLHQGRADRRHPKRC